MSKLPETGFLRLSQIIGTAEITEQQATENRERGKGPKRPRPAVPAIVPVQKTAWWDGVKSGRFPKPVKLGPRVTAWRVEDIRALIAKA
jgi:predicted DNA-binding transcriptional regulator AlpA